MSALDDLFNTSNGIGPNNDGLQLSLNSETAGRLLNPDTVMNPDQMSGFTKNDPPEPRQFVQEKSSSPAREPCEKCGKRLWFVMSYKRSLKFRQTTGEPEDFAFIRAGRTWAQEMSKNMHYNQLLGRVPEFDPQKDTMYVTHFSTEEDFRDKWNNIPKLFPGYKVYMGAIFAHSSTPIDVVAADLVRPGNQLDGIGEISPQPSLKPDPPQAVQVNAITIEEIRQLDKLDWLKNGALSIHACQSGLNGVAKAFKQKQGVPTYGMRGWAYFSKNFTTYDVIDNKTDKIYLESYDRGISALYSVERNPVSRFLKLGIDQINKKIGNEELTNGNRIPMIGN